MEASQMGRWTFKSAITFVSDHISLIFGKETKLDPLWAVYKQTPAQKIIRSINNRRREMTHPDDFFAILFYFSVTFDLVLSFLWNFHTWYLSIQTKYQDIQTVYLQAHCL